MQMTIECPTDGQVVVDVTDVNAIVFDRAGRCEISFICPKCGRELRQPVTPVAMQMAIVEANDTELQSDVEVTINNAAEAADAPDAQGEVRVEVDEAKAEAYLEYFRRQLDKVEDVDSALEEIDG